MKLPPIELLVNALTATDDLNKLLREIAASDDPVTYSASLSKAVGAAFNMAHEIQKLNRAVKKAAKL